MSRIPVYPIFFNTGEITEIRALGLAGKSPAWSGFCKTGIVSGYFDNANDFARAAEMLDKVSPQPPSGIYFTINPIKKALLARAANRLVGSPKYSSQDSKRDVLKEVNNLPYFDKYHMGRIIQP